jgi:dolichol-phosphate mannosyltransferase
MDQKVVRVLRKIQESNLFFRGIVKWLGFRQKTLPYVAADRFSGTSKYTFIKMFRFAMHGITSFSIKLLHLSTVFGLAFSVFAFGLAIHAFISHIFYGNTVNGWTSLMILLSLTCGIQLIVAGIAGEYLGKLFMEAKKRPLYIVNEDSASDDTSGGQDN